MQGRGEVGVFTIFNPSLCTQKLNKFARIIFAKIIFARIIFPLIPKASKKPHQTMPSYVVLLHVCNRPILGQSNTII